MSAEFGIVYPLWNHTREPGRLLERVVGEVGIDHLTVPAVTGPVAQFRPGWFRDAPYFQTEGGWHYPPQSETYSASGLRPRAAKWCGARDVLAAVREEAGKLGLKLAIRLDLAEIPNLLEHAPHVCQRDAWGSTETTARACVSSPAYRELIGETLADVARYEPAAIVLDNLRLDGVSHAPAAARALYAAGRWTRFCFCAACRQLAAAADVDPDAVARHVRMQCERELSRAEVGWDVPGGFEVDCRLAEYLTPRRADVGAWLKRLGENQRECKLFVVRRMDERRELVSDDVVAPNWLPLFDASRPPRADVAFEQVVEFVRACIGLSVSVALPVWSPQSQSSASDLVQRVSQIAATRAVRFDFTGLEEAPEDAVTWLKQAVRYARRG